MSKKAIKTADAGANDCTVAQLEQSVLAGFRNDPIAQDPTGQAYGAEFAQAQSARLAKAKYAIPPPLPPSRPNQLLDILLLLYCPQITFTVPLMLSASCITICTRALYSHQGAERQAEVRKCGPGVRRGLHPHVSAPKGDTRNHGRVAPRHPPVLRPLRGIVG